MKHNIQNKKLNKNSSHRKAMFMNMSNALIKHEQITTTLAKAKELRKTAEPLITLAKNDTLMRRRLAYSRLGDKKTVKKLFEVLGPRFKSRPGGYLRILKKGYRLGDASPVAYVLFSE